MGWFEGWFGSGNSNESDPLRNLDPKLREFLEKESPIKYTTSSEQQSQPLQPPQPQPQTKPTKDTDGEEKPAVPRESLYQDGRYAHLWKSYRPLSTVEAETKTDHEKLMDVLDAYKERKAHIGRAALENCADEQMDWNLCMKEGDWSKRVTMCREEVQKFERCYMTQSVCPLTRFLDSGERRFADEILQRLLKALGYISTYDRPPEVDEQIQMRADSIYHRMLEQEAAVEKAKAEGQPVPTFPPLFSGQKAPTTATAKTRDATPAAPGPAESVNLPAEPGPNTLKEWKEKLEKLPEKDRAAEEEALRAEYRAKLELAGRVQSIWQDQAKEREARKAEGKETIGDRVRGLLGK